MLFNSYLNSEGYSSANEGGNSYAYKQGYDRQAAVNRNSQLKNNFNSSKASYNKSSSSRSSASKRMATEKSQYSSANKKFVNSQNAVNKAKKTYGTRSRQAKGFGNLSKSAYNKQRKDKKKNVGDKYKNYNTYRSARSKAQSRLKSSKSAYSNSTKTHKNKTSVRKRELSQYNSSKSAYNKANTAFQKEKSSYLKSQSSYNEDTSALQRTQQEAMTNYSNLREGYTQKFGDTEKNYTADRNHSHNTWQDHVAGDRTFKAFDADTANTSYGISQGDYKYSTNMGDDDYRTKYNSDKDRVSAVKEAVKNYGGTLPYGGKAEDYEISGNGMLIPKGQNYSYADKSKVGQDGYKSDVLSYSRSRPGGSGFNRYTTHTNVSQTMGAKKFNEENEAMKNFRTVHGQSTWDNVQKYNSYSNDGAVASDTDFSSIGRYQNSFYNKNVSSGRATNQVSKRNNLNAAQRGGSSWENDDKDSNYYTSSSYQTYRPSNGYF